MPRALPQVDPMRGTAEAQWLARHCITAALAAEHEHSADATEQLHLNSAVRGSTCISSERSTERRKSVAALVLSADSRRSADRRHGRSFSAATKPRAAT